MKIHTYDIPTQIDSGKIDHVRLEDEIKDSSISQVLKPLRVDGNTLTVEFEDDITSTEKQLLTAIVKAHSGEPYPEETTPTQVEIVQEVASAPFASKVLATGQKLFRRKHGIPPKTCPAKPVDADYSITLLEIEVPYAICKINKIEIVGANTNDLIDFVVTDNALGSIQLSLGVPSGSEVPYAPLNQFGFDVNTCKDFYVDESNYDAELIQGMKVQIYYKNRTDSDTEVSANITLHEMR